MAEANAGVLTHRHIFGLKGDVKRLIHYVEETVCMCDFRVLRESGETR